MLKRSRISFCPTTTTSNNTNRKLQPLSSRGGFKTKFNNSHRTGSGQHNNNNKFTKSNRNFSTNRQQQDLDNVLMQLNNRSGGGNTNYNINNNSSSLISRLKDNLLQQKWANSLSQFDNTSDEIKKAKWRNFHFSVILEVNRKHNKSPVSKREQFEKVWGFLQKEMKKDAEHAESREQIADGSTLSEALATACWLRDKKLVDEVKQEVESRLKRKESSSNENNNKNEIQTIQSAPYEVLRPFAKKYYERYLTSDWESALSSVESFLASVGADQNIISAGTGVEVKNAQKENVETFVADEDDEDLDGSAVDIEAKLAALEKEMNTSNKKTSSPQQHQQQKTESQILENIHNLLSHCENPKIIENTIDFMANQQQKQIQQLPKPTEQTYSCLIHSFGRKLEWENALQVLSKMQNNAKQEGGSQLASFPRPGPYCYAHAIKAVVSSAKAQQKEMILLQQQQQQTTETTSNHHFLLHDVTQNLVNQMSDSQIPHTPIVVESIVGVFEGRSFERKINNNNSHAKNTAWLEALSYFTAIRLSTNLKGTKNTYESLMRMHERKNVDFSSSSSSTDGATTMTMNSQEKSANAQIIQNIYDAMKEDGLQPDAKSHVKLINSWSFRKARDLRVCCTLSKFQCPKRTKTKNQFQSFGHAHMPAKLSTLVDKFQYERKAQHSYTEIADVWRTHIRRLGVAETSVKPIDERQLFNNIDLPPGCVEIIRVQPAKPDGPNSDGHVVIISWNRHAKAFFVVEMRMYPL